MSEKPLTGDPQLTPSLDVTTPYVAQKVNLTIQASTAVDVTKYGGNVAFEIGSPYQGFVAYPSLGVDVVWATNNGTDTTWQTLAIVHPNGSDPLSFAGAVSKTQDTVSATLDSNEQGNNLLNPGTGKAIADPDVMPTFKIFKPAAGGAQPPTVGGTQQSPVSFQFKDADNPAQQIAAGQFTAIFAADTGTLQSFAIYSGRNEGSATKVTTFNASGTQCAVDSLGSAAPDNTQLNCWIVPASADNTVIDLQLSLGTVDLSLGIFMIFDYANTAISTYLPWLSSDQIFGGRIAFSQEELVASLYIKAQEYGALRDGDQVVLLINGQVSDKNDTVYSASWRQRAPTATLWQIPYTDSRWKIGTEKKPQENVIQYLHWSPKDPKPKLDLSPKYIVDVSSEGGLPPNLLPPPDDPDYGEPCIKELTRDKTVLNPPDFSQTIHVEVRWNGTNQNGKQSSWQPQDKDIITVSVLLNGYDVNGNQKSAGPLTTAYVLNKATDIDGKDFVVLSLPGYWFNAYGPKPDTTDYPTVQVQYNVAHNGQTLAEGTNSEIYTGQFDTIISGTGIG